MGLIHRLIEAASCTLAAWLETYAKIADKSGNIIRPRANPLQKAISDIIDWCEEVQRPIRIIVLKPRQKGCSTISTGALFRFLKLKQRRAAIIGSGYKQSANLLKILKTYANNDDWAVGGRCKVLKDNAKFSNGSEVDRLTANDPEAGRSGTYQVLVATEVARWAEQGVANAAEVLSGLLKTIGYEPDTFVILETTAAGAYGDYYDRYQKAVTLEEAKAGKPGYIKVFMPWFVFEDSKRDPATEQIYSVEDLTETEREYMVEWELDLERMAWFRWALREECNGDFDRFQQDYPSDEESAFLKSGRARFSAAGMKWQRKEVVKWTKTSGIISEHDNRVVWLPCGEKEATWTRWEEPRLHRRYLVSVDTMTGATQNGGNDPDSHSVKVLRAGYVDGAGRWNHHAVVCSLNLYDDGIRRGNWWDIDVLTQHVLWVSQYYGDCLIVPEVNMDRGMIELLKLEGAHIYQRQLFNKRTNEWQDAYGWNTTPRTRPMMIENLAMHIREAPKGVQGKGVHLNCPDLIRECEAFIRKENGREEAAQGAHDDQVLACAIGLQVIDLATGYVHRRRIDSLPPEIRRLEEMEERGGRGRGGGAFSV